MSFLVGIGCILMGFYTLYDLFTDFGFFWMLLQLPLGVGLVGIGIAAVTASSDREGG